MARISLLQIRRGTTAEWIAADPTLAIGEMGYDTTLALLKIGDGSTKWSSLTPHQGSVGTPVSPSSLNNQIARHDGTSGLVIQNSLATIDDSGSMDIPTGQNYKINNVAISTAWADYSPTLVWGTADPATITTVARWASWGKTVFFHIDISSADSNACSSLTISLPVGPVDNNDRTALSAIQKAGAGGVTYSNPLAYIDMDSASKLIKFYAFTTGTDAQAIAIIVSGSYEAA